MFEHLNEILDHFIDMGIPGNDILVCIDGEPVYRSFRGVSDRERKIPMNGKERYNIYSATKVFTVVAALQLYEKGAFQLDDPIADYLPEFAEMQVLENGVLRPAKRQITIRHLFTMTAGLTYDTRMPELDQAYIETEGRCPTRETMKYLAKHPLSFDPGEHWQYSLCHDVLAALVEVLSGERFGMYLKKHIFNVVGMPRTTMLLPEEELITLAAQYRYDPEKKIFENCGKANTHRLREKRAYRLGTEYESGGAGAVSCVEDYSRFIEALRVGDVILGRDTTARMATNELNDVQWQDFWQRPGYGYGLGVRCPHEGSRFTDFGWGGAAGAYLAIDPVHHFTIYYAQHVLASPNSGERHRLLRALRKDLGIDPVTPPAPAN